MQFTVDILPLAVAISVITGAIIGAATVYQRITKPLRQLLAEVRLLLADFRGAEARPGVRAVPGVLERLSTLEETAAETSHELRTNGGGSLRDLVMRMAAQQRVVSQHLGAPTLPPIHGEAVVMATPPAEWTHQQRPDPPV